MTLQEAVDAPRIHHQWWPDTIAAEPFALSADTVKSLTAMGYKVVALELGVPGTPPSRSASHQRIRSPPKRWASLAPPCCMARTIHGRPPVPRRHLKIR